MGLIAAVSTVIIMIALVIFVYAQAIGTEELAGGAGAPRAIRVRLVLAVHAMRPAVTHLAYSNAFGRVPGPHARLASELGVRLALSIQAIVPVVILVAAVWAIQVTVAHKLFVYAAARVAFEQLWGTREVSVETLGRWLVLATSTILETIKRICLSPLRFSQIMILFFKLTLSPSHTH